MDSNRSFKCLSAAAFAFGVFTLQPCAVLAQGAPTVASPSSDRLSLLGYSMPVPRTWQPQPPSSNMRAAQYRVPAAKGKGDAEAVVFYFGKGGAGSVAANTERWTSQFTSPDGKPVKPKLASHKIRDIPVTTVELQGTYARGVGMGQAGAGKPGQTLLVAVIEAPEGSITLQLHGDRDAVEAHRKGFDAMWRGFKKG